MGGSEVKEDIPQQQKDGAQDTSSVGISTADLPPHILVEMPALSPTMVRKLHLHFLLRLSGWIPSCRAYGCISCVPVQSQGNIVVWRKKEGDKVSYIWCKVLMAKQNIFLPKSVIIVNQWTWFLFLIIYQTDRSWWCVMWDRDRQSNPWIWIPRRGVTYTIFTHTEVSVVEHLNFCFC